jgi:hypothetical protein
VTAVTTIEEESNVKTEVDVNCTGPDAKTTAVGLGERKVNERPVIVTTAPPAELTCDGRMEEIDGSAMSMKLNTKDVK